MPRQFALVTFVLFISWLFVRDKKLRPLTSGALWIPLIWLLILSSRPISFWVSGEVLVENPEQYLEGSSLDKNVYLLLIVAAAVTLFRRGIKWNDFITANRWLVVFFLYCGITVIWSEYPFVGFKRWIKDIGNVLMVLVILTDEKPNRAVKVLIARWTYITIPLSVLFIKYYSDMGKYYTRDWHTLFCGVATDKNALGCIAFLGGIFLVWDHVEARTGESKTPDRLDSLSRYVLLFMTLWLIYKAQSSTSLVCLIMGVGLLGAMKHPRVRQQIRHIGVYGLIIFGMLLLFYAYPGIAETFTELVGRDVTFTGRTNLWADILRQPINPLIGTGYQSFWLGERAERLWELYAFLPNQAHNGYLDTYINSGLIGVVLLLIMFVKSGKKLKHEALLGNSLGMLLFSYFCIALLYNWTEAMFNRMSPIWVFQLLAMLSTGQISCAVTTKREVYDSCNVSDLLPDSHVPGTRSADRISRTRGGIE